MNSKICVDSLTHDELVTLFADSLIANDNFTICNDDDFYDNWYNTPLGKELAMVHDPHICFEDKIVAILENGGGVTFIDNYGEGDLNKTKNIHSYIDGDGNCCYDIFLRDILAGCSTDDGYKLALKIFVDETGDSWDAYNLLQIIIFGEEVYG